MFPSLFLRSLNYITKDICDCLKNIEVLSLDDSYDERVVDDDVVVMGKLFATKKLPIVWVEKAMKGAWSRVFTLF